ncbi:hypothetical protein BDV96DRAFT_221309 [Lophiotrema nucula]|uniref:FHA domain-containing protein n=1 Tax=Lophiotrema nucula TaxID=690887 RepID=A0A6A5YVF6_9PLEO|nr:hypothetical protein BDV96DRAFT_221309 [Lophiotrema nucula]
MWFLEHESLFGDKGRIWLKPGSQHLYGRTKSEKSEVEGRQTYIDNKAVSRQHMMLKIFDVPQGDGTKLHTRSPVEITDLSGRSGTTVDGKTRLIDKEGEQRSCILSGTEHTIKLGLTYPPFTIRWQPKVFTYASKESKESKTRSSKLHALDIKTTVDFVFDQTTHVVSQKRNLPKVLQGLVAGVPIITGDFLDAIVQAATPNVESSEPIGYAPCKLEEDFDAYWPKEKEYIAPSGAEPVSRPEQMLEPDPARAEVFSGLTFVFLDEGQYKSLHDPIAGGKGKALLFNLQPGETTVNEYVEFVRNASGEKRSSKARSGILPVVTVRPNFPDGLEEWATSFVIGIEQALNQRSIQQNEFLDAIITNDASSLQKPPSEVEAASSMPASVRNGSPMRDITTSVQSKAPAQTPTEEAVPTQESNKRKRPIRRGATASRFTGFDDYEPPPKSRKIEDTQMEDIQESAPTQQHSISQARSQTGARSIQRRQSPIHESVEQSMNIDELFPAAAAVRRTRLATRGPSASVEPEAEEPAPPPKSKGTKLFEKVQKVKKKADKEIDVREQSRLRMEAHEEQRRKDEESLQEALQGVDISEIRGLAQVEEMEIKQRDDRPNQRGEEGGERWNDEWNGRKNFKKFRRKGAERGPQAQKVIVALEEVPHKKGFGLGDNFFLEENDKPRSKEDERRLKRRQGRKAGDDDSDEGPGFSRWMRGKQTEVISVEDSEPDDEEIEEVSATQRSRRTTQRVEETQIGDTQTQTQGGGRKRGPATVAAGQPASKKTRTATRRNDDSDDEETGFRFNRRR